MKIRINEKIFLWRISMAESQNIEYKESWRDEYLKWVCGFANAQGGAFISDLMTMGRLLVWLTARNFLRIFPIKLRI